MAAAASVWRKLEDLLGQDMAPAKLLAADFDALAPRLLRVADLIREALG